MKIKTDIDHQWINCRLVLSKDDQHSGMGQDGPVSLISESFRFILPRVVDMHPDLLASALLTVALPFAGRRIELPVGVSSRLADEVYRGFKKELSPVVSQLEPRQPGNRPGLAFSGGNDSLATYHLMPENTALVFFERISHPQISYSPDMDPYQPLPALKICDTMRKDGLTVGIVQSDHPYVIGPKPDWATWIGVASPLMLLADSLNLDSIAFGSDLGSTFIPIWKDHQYFSWDFKDPYEDPFQTWMTAIGLPINRPIGGIDEIGTAIIVMSSPYHRFRTFCSNGPHGTPCMRCLKCLRKTMITAVVEGEELDKAFWDRFSEIPKVRAFFESEEMFNGMHSYMYCFRRIPPISNRFFHRVQNGMLNTPGRADFAARWYPEALKLVLPKYRQDFLARKNRFLQDYTDEDVQELIRWPAGQFHMDPPGLIEIAERLLAKGGRFIRRNLSKMALPSTNGPEPYIDIRDHSRS